MTPVILTLNEEENLGRCLASLALFPRVVVVDSGSTDGTERIARATRNVAWFVRPWDGFGGQWRYALSETGIGTPFVLALDADMAVPGELGAELAEFARRADVDGAVIGFEYRIQGRPLAGSLYPPQLRFLRLSKARAGQKGHAHVLEVDGRVTRARNRLVHDDRKGLEAFVRAQVGYSARELPALFEARPGLRIPHLSRRRLAFTPCLVWLLAWLTAGGPFRGAAARRYALERLIYEAMLRWRVEDRLLAGPGADRNPVGTGGGAEQRSGRPR